MALSPPFQAVLFFSDADGRGWTEKYWLGTDLQLTGLQNLFNTLGPARMGLSTTSVNLLRMRVGSTQIRSPYVIIPNNGAPIPGTLPTPTAETDNAVVIRFRSNAGYYNRIFLRGVPQAVMNLDEFFPDAAWLNNFQAYVSVILGNGSFVVRTRLASSPTKTPIVNLGPNTPKGITMTVPATVTLPIGAIIYIHGANIPGYNGLKVVEAGPNVVGTGVNYILGGANPISSVASSVQTYFTVVSYSTQGVSNVVVESVSNRKAGRPFGISRGRARTLFSLRP